MDFKKKFSTYFATFNSWESTDHELVASAATWVGRVEEGDGLRNKLITLCPAHRQSAFPAGSGNRNCVFGYHTFSIIDISFVNILLTWAIFTNSIDSSAHVARTPQKPCPDCSPLCIKALTVGFPGKGIARNCLLISQLKLMLPCASPGSGDTDQTHSNAQGQLLATPQSVWH